MPPKSPSQVLSNTCSPHPSILSLQLSTPGCSLEELALERGEAGRLVNQLRSDCALLTDLLMSPLPKDEEIVNTADAASIGIRTIGCLFRCVVRSRTLNPDCARVCCLHTHTPRTSPSSPPHPACRDALRDETKTALDIVKEVGQGDATHRHSTSLGVVTGWKPTPLARVSLVGISTTPPPPDVPPATEEPTRGHHRAISISVAELQRGGGTKQQRPGFAGEAALRLADVVEHYISHMERSTDTLQRLRQLTSNRLYPTELKEIWSMCEEYVLASAEDSVLKFMSGLVSWMCCQAAVESAPYPR